MTDSDRERLETLRLQTLDGGSWDTVKWLLGLLDAAEKRATELLVNCNAAWKAAADEQMARYRVEDTAKDLQAENERLRKLIADSRRPHGTCKPRTENACTNCAANEAMDEIARKALEANDATT